MPTIDPPNAIHLRPATSGDAATINAIYNHYVLHSDSTLQLKPSTDEERHAWLEAQASAGLPVLIAEKDGEPVGWGALVKFNPREGYRFTLEDSVYVHHQRHGRGVGKALLTELLDRARALGAHSVIAKITGSQAPSIALHRAFGFVEVGRLPEVGFKFERWVDVVMLQRRL